MTPTRVLPARALSAFAALALSFGGAVLVTAGPASADTTTVTNTADDGTSTSLRGVLETANDGDVVVLTAGATYELTICDPPAPSSTEGSAGWGDVEITGAVTIVGNGATIEQTCEDRVLYTQDAITLEHVTVTGGLTKDPGGGLFQDSSNATTLTGVTFTGNSAGAGGGLATGGDVTATGATFSDNHALEEHGGGIRVYSDDATVKIDGSNLFGNTADGWGGAFEQQGREQEAGAAADGVFTLEVTNSVVSGNSADSDGAGGLDTEDPATITIDHSTIAGNEGGGGGGIGAYGDTNALSVNASTFAGNSTPGNGSAVYLSGPEPEDTSAAAAPAATTADFTNSTITGNTEGSFGAVTVHGAVTFNHVTMTKNTSAGIEPEAASSSSRNRVDAFAIEGDAANVAAHTFSSANSVVAQPQGALNCVAFDAPATDGGYNFSDDDSCGFTNPTSNVKSPNDPVLGALANNGGPTETLLPLAGSPLLDAIPSAVCGASVDQRGVTRPQGTGCDVGAVEVEVAAPAPAAVVTPKFTG